MKTDEFDMLYVLETNGWSSCFLYLGGDEPYYMGTTHVFNDPTQELLDALTCLLQGNTEAKFSWYDEPGEYQWRLTRDENRHHLIALEILDYSDNEHTVHRRLLRKVSCEVKLKVLCICVLSQMRKIRNLLKEKSYQKNRDFPEGAYRKFAHAFRERYQ